MPMGAYGPNKSTLGMFQQNGNVPIASQHVGTFRLQSTKWGMFPEQSLFFSDDVWHNVIQVEPIPI